MNWKMETDENLLWFEFSQPKETYEATTQKTWYKPFPEYSA